MALSSLEEKWTYWSLKPVWKNMDVFQILSQGAAPVNDVFKISFHLHVCLFFRKGTPCFCDFILETLLNGNSLSEARGVVRCLDFWRFSFLSGSSSSFRRLLPPCFVLETLLLLKNYFEKSMMASIFVCYSWLFLCLFVLETLSSTETETVSLWPLKEEVLFSLEETDLSKTVL